MPWTSTVRNGWRSSSGRVVPNASCQTGGRTAAGGRRSAEASRAAQVPSRWDTGIPEPASGRVLGVHALRQWNDSRGGRSCGDWTAVGPCGPGPALGLAIRGLPGAVQTLTGSVEVWKDGSSGFPEGRHSGAMRQSNGRRKRYGQRKIKPSASTHPPVPSSFVDKTGG